jgi:hypothetical protein
MEFSTVGLAGFLFLAVGCAIGQQAGKEIVIEVKDTSSQPLGASARYSNGYRSPVQGQTIDYHSSEPGLDSALLVRGQNVASSISWETDPLPDTPGDFSQFIWLAGIECGGFPEERATSSIS